LERKIRRGGAFSPYRDSNAFALSHFFSILTHIIHLFIPQLSVNKKLTNIKRIKIQAFPLLENGCDKTGIEELSSDVYFIILFTLRENRCHPIFFVAKGSR